MYFYFKYLATGEIPLFIIKSFSRVGIDLEKSKELPFHLKKYMPPEKPEKKEKFITIKMSEKLKTILKKFKR
jgi:hypothetical protein